MSQNNTNITWLFFALGMIVLSVTLLFPVESDLSIFVQGSIILLDDGGLSLDYNNIKSPFVYYISEMLVGLFGKSIIGYRIFDFFYHTLFLLSSIYIFRKLNIKNSIINIFLIVTPLLYTTLGYSNLIQVESMFLLPFIWYFYLSVKSDNNYKSVIAKGVLLALIFNLKYTLGIVLVADIYFTVSNNQRSKQTIINIIIQLSAFASLTFLFFLPAILNGNTDGMLKFMDNNSVYGNYSAWSFSHILYLIKSMTIYFSDNMSLFLIISFLLALTIRKDSKQKQLTKIGLVYFSLLIISIVSEGISSTTNFIRLIPVYVLLSSIGINYLYFRVKESNTIIIIIALLFTLIYSPLPRFINLIKITYNNSSEVKSLPNESLRNDFDVNSKLK